MNVFWAGPRASRSQDVVVNEAKANPSIAGLAEGQFKPSQDGNAVLFIGNVKGTFNDVFWRNCGRTATNALRWWWPSTATSCSRKTARRW